jgi:hypothetical protein
MPVVSIILHLPDGNVDGQRCDSLPATVGYPTWYPALNRHYTAKPTIYPVRYVYHVGYLLSIPPWFFVISWGESSFIPPGLDIRNRG